MCIMKKQMTKDEFVGFMSQIILEPQIGYENPELGLKLTDFANWTDWFRFGEWDDGSQWIYVRVEEGKKDTIAFLKRKGFVFQ